MNKYLLVITTTARKKDAQRIGKVLIDKRLAACVQILGPIQSHYVWKNRVEVAKEYLCLIKSTKKNYKKIEKTIREIHPYEVPEIVAMDISAGYKPYLNWIDKTEKRTRIRRIDE